MQEQPAFPDLRNFCVNDRLHAVRSIFGTTRIKMVRAAIQGSSTGKIGTRTNSTIAAPICK